MTVPVDTIAGRVAVPLGRGRGDAHFGFDEFSISRPDEMRFGSGHAEDTVELRTGKDRFILPLGVLEEMIATYRQVNGL